MKHQGYVTWQTIQLLLAPDEHVPFLQRAVQRFDIINPQDGSQFPKVLPAAAFPSKPDEEMLDWFDEVNERLTQEAHAEQRTVHQGTGPGAADLRADDDSDDSANERSGAAKYFSNPLYRDGSGRPTVVRRYSKQRGYSPSRSLYDRGKGMVRGVRHFISPSYRDTGSGGSRRSSFPDRPVRQDALYRPSDYDEIVPAPNTLRPDYLPPAERAAMRAAQRRARTPSSGTSTDSDVSPRSSRRASEASPNIVTNRPSPSQRRGDDPRADSRDYFPARYPAEGRRHSAHPHSPGPAPYAPPTVDPSSGFRPSEAPLFATQVAQSFGRRTSREDPAGSPVDSRDRPAYRDDRDRRDQREGGSRPNTARRRSPSRERDGAPLAPTSSGGRYAGPVAPVDRNNEGFSDVHRVQSEQRRGDRDRDRERERDRDRHGAPRDWDADRRRSRSQPKEERPKMPRYITPVDGVSGRRYVSPVWGDRWDGPGAVGGDGSSGRTPLHRVGFAEGS